MKKMSPLIEALKNKYPRVPERLFSINKEEIPLEAKFDSGDNAKFVIHGKVKSRMDDGSFQMQVHRVEHQANPEEDANEPQEVRVVTQESHTP